MVDRLEAQRLVRRSASAEDGRSMIVSLTPAGERLFDKAFAAHLAHLRRALGGLGPAQLQGLEDSLRNLRDSFESAPAAEPSPAAGRSKARRTGEQE